MGGFLSLWLCGVSLGAEEGITERVGKKIDEAAEKVRQETKNATEQIREGYEKVRASVQRMGVAARVYARLHWDKALSEATIWVDVDERGVAVLRGTVPSGKAQRKAGELAQETVGVNRVVNDLKVTAPSSVPAAK